MIESRDIKLLCLTYAFLQTEFVLKRGVFQTQRGLCNAKQSNICKNGSKMNREYHIPQALLVVADLAFLKTVSETKKEPQMRLSVFNGSPSGVRTRVTGVRGRRPRPLDDGTISQFLSGFNTANMYLMSNNNWVKIQFVSCL